MRHILFLLFMAFTLQAIAQYPATGNKMRLGWQTTGDGLVYRGAIGDTATLDPSGLNNAWMLLDTANGNLYAYRAKAWRLVSGGGGSVSDTLTGEVKGPLDSTYIDTVANIIFRLDSTAVGVGEVKYNDTQGSIQQGLKGGNVTNVIGQQLHQRVLNKTGSPLAKGEAVYLQGSQGNRITVAKAIATIDSTSANTFGIVAESIANNQSGYIITEGLITGLNTNSLTEGMAVYLSPTVAGGLTTTKPQAPDHGVYIGVCVKQNNGSGELFVKIRNGQELEELHDVRITSPASNASLYYNAAQGVWRDTGAAVLVADTTVMLSPYLKKQDTLSLSNRINTKLNISDTSVFARDFQISGTANYLAKFTGSNAVGNSVIQDNGTNVGISATPSSFKLDINGSTHTTGDFYADRAARSASAGFVSAQTNNRWLAGMISNSGNWHVYDLLRSTSVMTLDSATGNVGIGTTTPRTPLDIRFSGSYPNYYTDTIARVEFNETGAGCCMDITGMYVKANGGGGQSNVGIIGEGGGVSYDKSIGIKGIAKHNDTQGPGIAYGVIGEVSASKLGSSGAIGTTIAGYFKNTAKVDGTHYGVLVETDSSGDYGVYQTGFGANYFQGNVGIGTASPLSTPAGIGLTLGTTSSGRSLYMVSSSDGNNGLIQFKDQNGADALQIAGTSTSNFLYGYGSRPLSFFTNVTERMRIDASGNVGIGTASPGSYLLNLRDSIGFSGNGMYFSSTNGGTANPGGYIIGTKRGSWGTRIDFVARDAAGSLTETVMSIDGEGGGGGNVGINTSSPSRPLHVAGTTAIRIPVGTTSDRGTSANGDIRYNTTNANFEWHTGTAWREPVNAARSPNTVGIANSFSKFDANGLLDTSAILIQANNKIGIFNSPAAGDSALTVTGGIRATRDMYARQYNVSTFTGQVVSINNYAPAGSPGNNLWIGNGGQLSTWASGDQGSNNVSLGSLSLEKNTSGESNVGIGTSALNRNTSGSNNLALGYASLFSNTIGSYNTAIGRGALVFNTIGNFNTGIGYNSLIYSTTGSFNIALGSESMYFNTSGTSNTAIGPYALYSNTTGSGNVALGTSSGRYTNIGGANQISSNSIYIGGDTRASASGNTNEIVIGDQGRGNGSNTTTIGNSSTTATILPAGSLSVSTTSTTNKMNINGNAVIGSSYIGTAAPADGLLVVGNVGIGASSVDYKLHCAGVGYFGTGLRVDYTAAFDANTIFQMPNTSTKAAKGYAWNTYSDARIKSNFDTIQNALQAVQALKPVYYDQHDSEVIDGKIKLQDGKTRTVGFIAQDVAPVIPAAVQAGNDTQLWGMDYTKLIPYLTKAIQEQQAQIEALKKEIEALKNK